MLVLTRKRDEIIKIGNDIVIKVIKTGNGSVKIGIEAPSSVRVLRGEVATVELEVPEVTELEFHDQISSLLEECTLDAVLVQN